MRCFRDPKMRRFRGKKDALFSRLKKNSRCGGDPGRVHAPFSEGEFCASFVTENIIKWISDMRRFRGVFPRFWMGNFPHVCKKGKRCAGFGRAKKAHLFLNLFKNFLKTNQKSPLMGHFSRYRKRRIFLFFYRCGGIRSIKIWESVRENGACRKLKNTLNA